VAREKVLNEGVLN